ncbi:MAG: bifunctional diaminohydroxyphosphoribosylaminopyrimidine deaminase/5-amino-6-(5-phosphoribosylamino)uracil reductase RibD [Bacteroidetes bacterium]|nr:MAG: bifunctional diaminohydroxyphosphoribosylaminopyrimidine deaminase/5-amino-6-(5-phosphoribosylamino)uracil reductase RibD [Bacteroidota bacterium]
MLTQWDALYLERALELARRAAPPAVEPNPPVGAVIAVGEQVLGEGYHAVFGGPHAEIVALQAVKTPELLPQATLYVTLEPCCHTGKKTPPCVPALLEVGLRRVVVGTLDPNPAVRGAGLRALRAAGVEVLLAPNPRPFRKLLRHFWVNIRYDRPYITLKWAQTPGSPAGGVIGHRTQGQWPISGFWGRVWGHRLRTRHSHLAVGYRTWLLDQPSLTARLWPGLSPQPLVFYDPRRGTPTLPDRFTPIPLEKVTQPFLQALYRHYRVGSLLIEGGNRLLQQFLAAGWYDEVHILVSEAAALPPPQEAVWAPAWPRLRWKRHRLSATEEVWVGRPFTRAPHPPPTLAP